MGLWKSRIYTCKNNKCKKSVEVKPKDDLVCDVCNTPLVGDTTGRSAYLTFNGHITRRTDIEFNTASHDETIKDFRKQKWTTKQQ